MCDTYQNVARLCIDTLQSQSSGLVQISISISLFTCFLDNSVTEWGLLFSGLDYWTGLLDWNTGLEHWTGTLDWNTGLEHWTGTLDWTTGLTYFWFLHILRLDLRSLASKHPYGICSPLLNAEDEQWNMRKLSLNIFAAVYYATIQHLFLTLVCSN